MIDSIKYGFKILVAGLMSVATMISIAQAQGTTSTSTGSQGVGGTSGATTTTPGVPSTGVGPTGAENDLLVGAVLLGSVALIALIAAIMLARKLSSPS